MSDKDVDVDVDDFIIDDSDDLEFKTHMILFDPEAIDNEERVKAIEQWLNDGWSLDDKIVCPPFVMLIFSRVKEIEAE